MIPVNLKNWDSGPYLLIDNKYNLYLICKDSRTRLDLPPVLRSLYLFYLKHPEGVCRYRLPEYENQIRGIYEHLLLICNPKGKKARIDHLVNRFNNSFNEKCTLIKKAFNKSLGEKQAASLYIDGERKDAKSISFSRERVIWEKELPQALVA